MSTPTWSAVDDNTADLLDLIAEQNPATPQERDEYPIFLDVLRQVASANDGFIDQNRTRPILRGQIKHCRTGPFFHRACREGLIRAEGWTVTTRSPSGNGGKPARSYVWLGTGSTNGPIPT